MIYRQLSLAAGGGIVANVHKSDQPNHATIAIGLGGTGIECLRIFKQHVYDCIQPDDPDAAVPTYRHFKFLAVDDDWTSVTQNGRLNDIGQETEYFNLSVGNFRDYLEGFVPRTNDPLLAWCRWNPRRGPLPTSPACGLRWVGRLMLITKSEAFKDRLVRLIQDARVGFYNASEIHVHIFNGTGGKIGSGTFLDVCYIVQHALQMAGAYGQSRIFGYCFLPDVTLGKLWEAPSGTVSQYIKANSYAFMKELDYCMNFDRNQGHWEQHYRGFKVDSTTMPPVHVCYLVSSSTINGRLLADPSTPMKAVAEQILFGDPFIQVAGPIRTSGRYAILGASGVELPLHEMNNYLVARTFSEMGKIGTKVPTNADIEAFANDNGLTFRDLLRSLIDKTSYQMPALELDYKLYTSMEETDLALPNEVHLPSSILGYYHEAENKMLGRVEANKQALLHEWNKDNIKEDQNSISKMCRVYYALSDVVSDATKGPLYAAAILKGTRYMNLVDLLKGILQEARSAIVAENMNISLRISTIKTARTKFLHPGIKEVGKSKRRLFEAFLQTIQQYKTSRCKIQVLSEIESLTCSLIDQMERLYDEHFKIYALVTENLLDTFYENYRYLTNRTKLAENPLVMPLMSMEQLQVAVEPILVRMNMTEMFGRFHTYFFRMHDAWIHGDENRIRKAVTDWSLSNVCGDLDLTFTDCMEMVLKTNHPAVLTKAFYDAILKPCYQNSVPFFSTIPEFLFDDKMKTVCCRIPESAGPVVNAVNMLQQVHPAIYTQFGWGWDKMSMTCCAYGISLEEYGLAKACYVAYQEDRHHRLHIYEGTPEDPRDWKQLPDIVQ